MRAARLAAMLLVAQGLAVPLGAAAVPPSEPSDVVVTKGPEPGRITIACAQPRATAGAP